LRKQPNYWRSVKQKINPFQKSFMKMKNRCAPKQLSIMNWYAFGKQCSNACTLVAIQKGFFRGLNVRRRAFDAPKPHRFSHDLPQSWLEETVKPKWSFAKSYNGCCFALAVNEVNAASRGYSTN
jgi:hypothetical protein